MGFKLQFFVGALLALGGYLIFSSHFSTPKKVEVDEKSWFGPGQPRKDDETIRPFKIAVPDEVLNVNFDIYFRISLFILRISKAVFNQPESRMNPWKTRTISTTGSIPDISR